MDYDVLDQFEQTLCAYTGATYAVLTDSCTHAIELCLRQQNITGTVGMPRNTYISALMVLHKLGLTVEFTDDLWRYEYNYQGTRVWDSARGLDQNMYRTGQMQCLSFGHTKRLEIGHGGAVLLDNHQDYLEIKRLAYDGRDLNIKPWQNQVDWRVGYHYNMRLEDAVKGKRMLLSSKLKSKNSQLVNYPDVSKLKIEI